MSVLSASTKHRRACSSLLAVFTSGAREAAAKAHFRIVLIDGDQLAEYMIDHGVGVTDYKTYTVKKLDSDYFEGL